MCLEGTNETLQESCSFPVTVAVDAGPQLMPGAPLQVLSVVPQEVCTPGQCLLLLTSPFLSGHGYSRNALRERVVLLWES